MDRRDFMQYTGFGLAGLMVLGFGKAVAAETMVSTMDVGAKKAIADTALDARATPAPRTATCASAAT